MNLNELAQQGEPQDPSMDAEPGQTEQAAKQPASPEQQAQFDMLLGRARQIMGETAEEWMQALKLDPVATAVKFGTQTLRHLAQQSEQAGQPVDPAVLIHAGIQLAKDVAGIANEAGVVPDEKLEGFLQDVMQQSIAEYLRMDADEGLLQTGEGAPDMPPEQPEPEGVNLAQMAQQGGVQ